jgi:hypothetical protein
MGERILTEENVLGQVDKNKTLTSPTIWLSSFQRFEEGRAGGSRYNQGQELLNIEYWILVTYR